ncbi:MAG: exonuclease SbcCD subunit D [Polyangiales bacterium]
MRFVHSADWHLGKSLAGFSLLEDQAAALEQVEAVCRDERVDALLVAGDIYDRSVPPTDAIRLFDDFLARMAKRAKVPVVVISGNHDGAERLGFAADFLAESGLHVRTRFADRTTPVRLERGGVTAFVHTLPFLEPEAVRLALGDDAVRDHDAAVRAALEGVRPPSRNSTERHVLMAHLFCTGGFESPESERPLAVGTAGHVQPSSLQGFDYVALGHLHRPQAVGGAAAIRYAGSLLKYSLSEASQSKSLTVVDLAGAAPVIREVPTLASRDVVELRAPVASLLTDAAFAAHERDFVAVRYTDDGFVLHAAERLRVRFPYLLQALPDRVAQFAESEPTIEHRPDTPRALLEAFWEQVGVAFDLEEPHRELFERLHREAGTQGEDA